MIIGEIDATSEKFFNDSLIEEHKQFLSYGSRSFTYDYKIEECVLVRTTEFFPFDGKIVSAEHGYGTVNSAMPGLSSSIYKLISKEEPNMEKAINISKNFDIVQRIRRNTLHFCINGLVGSHTYGDFTGRDFIIIEPMKHHVKDENLKGLLVEDTYFEGDVELSTDATILIRREVYDRIKDDSYYSEQLKRYNIIIFDGQNENMAIGKAINMLGYDSFVVSSNGYTNGLSDTPASVMYKFIYEYATENKISQTPHFYSEYHLAENDRMNEESIEITKRIISTMCLELGKDEELINKLYSILDTTGGLCINKNDQVLFDYLVMEYGLERLKSLVDKINQETLDAINEEKNKGQQRT